VNRPPQKPSHLNSPVVHHRLESSGGPLRLWATVAAGAVLIAALLFLAWIFDSPDEQSAPIDSNSVVGLL
jgi:hypothetical protein